MKVATEDDLKSGAAVFCIPDGRSAPYDLGALPLQGRLRSEIGSNPPIPAGTVVSIVQTEIVDGKDILIGFRCPDDAAGVCSLEEIEVLE